MILAPDNLVHLLRGLTAAILKPHFYDRRETAFKEFHMILKKLVIKMLFCKFPVIFQDLVLIVMPQLKISLIKNPVLSDMAKQPQKIITVIPLFYLIPVQFA